MKKVGFIYIKNVIISILCLVLLAGNILLIHNADIFGSPFFFILGMLAEIILLIILIYNIIRVLKTPFKILYSIIVSAIYGISKNEYIKSLVAKNKKVSNWLKDRLDNKKPTGLILTIGVIISTVFLFNFIGILQDVIFHDLLTKIDIRVANLIPLIRTPLQTKIFTFFTFLANYQTVVLLAVLTVGTLWFTRKKFLAGLFLVAVVIEEVVTYILKNLVGRVRPEQALGLISEDRFSFPSGHTMIATFILGLLFYFIFKSLKSSFTKLLLFLAYLIIVVMVVLSRVYLGVHFPSDVLASIMLGALLLTIFIVFAEIITKYNLWKQDSTSFKTKYLVFIPVIIVIFALVVNPFFIKLRVVNIVQNFEILNSLDEVTVQRLPKYSETLLGNKMEPISFVFIGSNEQIGNLFLEHGWYKADASTIDNTLKAFSFGFQNKQYLTAPVTPSYLDSKPETIAFQHPTSLNTLRQRHHIRLWKTNFKLLDGREIWVATASFDDKIEFLGPIQLLPTHHIDPNIDAERSYIIESLGTKNVNYINLVSPQIGKNAAGDSFFTDGKVAVIYL